MESLTKNQVDRLIRGESDAPTTFTPGPLWTSFEKFRTQGAATLSQIKSGTVATLICQGRQFRLLRENDFQHVLGLAREVERVRRGLRVVLAAVQTVQEHPGNASVNTLVEAVMLLGDSPVLPTRRQFEELQPEGDTLSQVETEDDDEDEVELNPDALRRPYEAEDVVCTA